MQRHLVHSSRIRSVGWENDTLEIEFTDGKIYQYDYVSYSEYQSFMNSASLGRSLSYPDKTHPYRRVG